MVHPGLGDLGRLQEFGLYGEISSKLVNFLHNHPEIQILLICVVFFTKGGGLSHLGSPSPTHLSGVQLNTPQSRVWPTARAFTPILLYTIILCTCVFVHPGVCSNRA